MAEASSTDLVNSGSYFTELLVLVFGITTLVAFGGSFLVIGDTLSLIDTNDLGSTWPGFLATTFGAGGSGLAATFGAGLATGFATTFDTGFFATGLGAAFLGAGFLGTDFFTVFFATGFPPDGRAGFTAAF